MNFMTENKKKLLQAKHRLEEAEMRNRNEERKARSVREFFRLKQQQQAQQRQPKRKIKTVGNDKISAGVRFERCTPAFCVIHITALQLCSILSNRKWYLFYEYY